MKPSSKLLSQKVCITEGTAQYLLIRNVAVLRAWVPRSDTEVLSVRPFDIRASELNALIELKPEGKVSASYDFV